jgi:hypothetical protein
MPTTNTSTALPLPTCFARLDMHSQKLKNFIFACKIGLLTSSNLMEKGVCLLLFLFFFFFFWQKKKKKKKRENFHIPRRYGVAESTEEATQKARRSGPRSGRRRTTRARRSPARRRTTRARRSPARRRTARPARRRWSHISGLEVQQPSRLQLQFCESKQEIKRKFGVALGAVAID